MSFELEKETGRAGQLLDPKNQKKEEKIELSKISIQNFQFQTKILKFYYNLNAVLIN